MARLGADTQYVTQALTLLLLMFVRGRDGVCFVGVTVSERMQMMTLDFDNVVRLVIELHDAQTRYESDVSWASHIEGRHTSQSGMNPVRALLRTATRAVFVEVAEYWATFLSEIRRGSELSPVVLMAMAHAVCGNIALRAAVHAGKYTVQQVCKYLSHMLPELYGCARAPYTQELHEYVLARQTRVCWAVDLLGFADAKHFNKWYQTLRVPRWLGTADGIDWCTAWVHLCEVRQVLQRYTVKGVIALMKRPVAQYKEVQRQAYHELVLHARRGRCFAVAMVAAVAASVSVDIKRRKAVKRVQVSVAQLRYIMAMMAMRGFSPKVCMQGIPEWHASKVMLRMCFAHMRAQTVLSRAVAGRIRKRMGAAELRSRATTAGLLSRKRMRDGTERRPARHEVVRMLLAQGTSID